ncbi:galactokinase, partial [bacterium]|nr:galactokinase [bacterium]
ELAILCRKAENEFVGVDCGIMDQLTSARAKKGMVMFIDCVKFDIEYIPFDEQNYAIVLCDTKMPRTLAESEYNIRKAESKKGLDIVKSKFPKVSSFRDLDYYEHVSSIKSEEFSNTIYKRLIHIIREIDRVKKSKDFLSGGNYKRLGKEFIVSHESSRNLYEVSCRELDFMVELGSKFTGALGSKLTGAGFGGSTIHLVERRVVDEFMVYMRQEYSKTMGIEPETYLIETSFGVKTI